MSEQAEKLDDSKSSPKIIKKFRKGDLVKAHREKYINSLESKASDDNLPEYIFEGPGEILLIKGDYCQVRWRRPVPDTWISSEDIIEFTK
tara:strand:+ start:162 stop:431 length:270 start_codon:yes stop_codon:yes gene_type:complete